MAGRDALLRGTLRAPSSLFALGLLAAAFAFALVLVQLSLVEYAYRKIGIDSQHLFALLVASFVGGGINVPVARLRREPLARLREVRAFGIRYAIPEFEESQGTIVAVNVGGALLPLGISGYLLWTHSGSVWPPFAVAAVVTAVVHRFARPVPGLGIAIPLWIPPLVAAASALLLAPDAPARAAYVGGTLGSLVGADLMNLGKLRGLGAPFASIGGAGTFDGIFMTGILAALLA
jgi:uncharacterized membrane protein